MTGDRPIGRRLAVNLAGLGLLARAGCRPAVAADVASWATHPVTVLVPFVPGGSSDIVARAMAVPMQAAIGQPVVVENRVGANGEVAARALIRSPRDGHTMMIGSIGTYAINVAVRKRLGYDPLKDFTPITLAATTPSVLVVNPRLIQATDLDGVLSWLRANRRTAAYSSSGFGSSDHMAMELFKQTTGADIAHVPYSGGGAAAADLIAGNVQLSFQNVSSVANYVQGGLLRPILVSAGERSAVLPQVPTGLEVGLKDFVVLSWQGIAGPAGLPEPLLQGVSDAVRAALKDANTSRRLSEIGFDVVASAPSDFASFLAAEIARWRDVARDARIEPE
ncbi:tripartite tricarboxylate transporter substrate binding protein [Roseomonas gilardii]|uniref:Bug family tripartite tricarboxylate transporter substrate binding protein n=1 Tax=Roseomonas gilardii TaxID=257708 RepID=UPI0021B650DB|nr:tripartite tricarboxylate transporter substrate-binding protein [Roseomonas gilardii]